VGKYINYGRTHRANSLVEALLANVILLVRTVVVECFRMPQRP